MFFSDVGAVVALGTFAVPVTFLGIALTEHRPRLASALFCGGLAVIVAMECVLASMLLQ